MPVDVLWQHPAAEDSELALRVESRAERLLVATGATDRELSLVLIDDLGMRTLNRRWRGLDTPTDVLSFPMDEGEPVPGAGDPRPLGDIVVSLDTAREQGQSHGHSMEQEITFLVIHGLCHLLGLDHANPLEAAVMRGEEDRLLALVAPGQLRPPTPY